SADDKLILTSSEDNSTWLWEAASGKAIRQFKGHVDVVNGAVFSPDSAQILTAGSDNSARLWETSTGKEIRRFGSMANYVVSVRFSYNGKYILTAGQDPFNVHKGDVGESNVNTARLWDLETGKELRRFKGHAAFLTSAVFSRDGKYVLTASNDKTARLWDAATGQEVRRFKGHRFGLNSAAFSADGRYVLTAASDNTARLWDIPTGKVIRQFKGHTQSVNTADISPNGKYILTASDDMTARLWQTATGKEVRRFNRGGIVESAVFSPDGRYVLTAVGWEASAYLWETATGKLVRQFKGHISPVKSAIFSPNGKTVLTASGDRTASLWDAATGKEVQRFEGHVLPVLSAVYSPDGRLVLTGGWDGSARLWEAATGKELCGLMSFIDGSWAVVDPEGRFDSNNLDEIKGLCWILPDAPMTPLAPEIFLRQYYEPRLLARIVAREKLPPVPNIGSLNRVQPQVKIRRIAAQPQDASRVEVTVEVATQRESFLQDGKEIIKTGEVYDVRLFRDGQLVGYTPEQDGKVTTDPNTGKAAFTFTVQLRRRADRKQVVFSAYAFNQDRVKSATDLRTYSVPDTLPIVKGHAYVISLGVNAYEDNRWNLHFASADARSLQESLCERLAKSGQFVETVSVPLVSDYSKTNAPDDKTAQTATKANFHCVLDILAGRVVSAAMRKSLPNAEKIRKANPEDLILFTFSCHGDADGQGNFYLFPYDIGPKQDGSSPDLFAHGISSTELSLWLRDVDAGTLAMIVDACHAAATVNDGQFKPGPMGSRGLGQLAYDKGMRILAASQADDVAIESRQINHGLLTYALVHDGLQAERADWNPRDNRIELDEWLEYGVIRVPKLYEEMKTGALRTVGAATDKGVRLVSPGNSRLEKRRSQQPSLFDFVTVKDRMILDSLGRR
ncbi:MAG TPA: hypothetical protein VKT77_12060, partial [Chthonomonadaceae bacterium]|nr:hypothetical protein [Chthonomonadaceae bacterium]